MKKDQSNLKKGRRSYFFVGILCAIILGGVVAGIDITQTKALQKKIVTEEPQTQVIEDISADSISKEDTKIAKTKTYSVPILMYHYIRTVTDPSDKLGYNLSVTPDNFDKQISWLEQNHYTTYPLADFCDGKTTNEGKPIVLTFDDGYDDAYTNALPVLKKHHTIGTFFVVSGFIDQPRYLSLTQLNGLKEAGMELGAHTVKHINLAAASLLRQKQEIENSKQTSPVFAYPAGQYSESTIEIVKNAGYKCAVTTKYGIATEKSPLFELPRVRITGSDSVQTFAEKVEGKK